MIVRTEESRTMFLCGLICRDPRDDRTMLMEDPEIVATAVDSAGKAYLRGEGPYTIEKLKFSAPKVREGRVHTIESDIILAYAKWDEMDRPISIQDQGGNYVAVNAANPFLL